MKPLSDRARLGLGLIPSVAILLLYAPSVCWPFYWDDLHAIVLVQPYSYWEIFTSTIFGRYRPFVWSFVKLLQSSLGPKGAIAGHFLALSISMINAALVNQVARGFFPGRSKWRLGAIAGLLFAVYPLSYQAVPLIAGLAHPTSVLLSLVAVLSYLRFRRIGHWPLFGLTCLSVTLAPLVAETGIVVGVLVALTEGVGWARRRSVFLSPWSLVPLVLSVFLSLWLVDVVDAHMIPGVTNLKLNGVYILQGFASPVSVAARALVSVGWGEIGATFLVSTVAIVFLLGVLFSLSARRLSAIFGFGWFLIAASVPWWTLPYEYIVNRPPVLYMASIGMALVWAHVFDAGFTRLRRRWLSLGAFAATVFFGVLVMQQNLNLYRLGLSPVTELAKAAAYRSNERLLVVNFPGWLAWPELNYVLGHEGAMILGIETPVRDLVGFNAPQAADVASLAFDNVRLTPPYYVGVYGESVGWETLAEGIRRADDVYLTRYEAEQVTLAHVGRVTMDAASEFLASFDHQVWLTAAESELRDGVIEVKLQWLLASETAGDEIFVHVFDCSGNVLGLKDGPALGGMYPIWLWGLGEAIVDLRHITFSEPPPDDCYWVEVGLFDPVTGERPPAFDPSGAKYVNSIVLISP